MTTNKKWNRGLEAESQRNVVSLSRFRKILNPPQLELGGVSKGGRHYGGGGDLQTNVNIGK